MEIQENRALANSLGLSSIARWYCEASTQEEVLMAAQHALAIRKPLITLGSGTNVVLSEQLDAVVVHLVNRGIRQEEDLIHVAAGEVWHDLVAHTLDRHCYGLENLALIPGTVGAAPVQNIGAYGVELSNFIDNITAIHKGTLEVCEFSASDCGFSYRNSIFKVDPDWIITDIRLQLNRIPSPVLDYDELARFLEQEALSSTPANVFNAVTTIRTRKLPDPLLEPNAGSFFKNPKVPESLLVRLRQEHVGLPVFSTAEEGQLKVSAAWLIDQAGLKGRRIGGFEVSSQHALVIVNRGAGKLQDLLALVRDVQATVFDLYEIELEPEPRFLQT